MIKNFNKHILKNGMVLLGEPIKAVESVAFNFMLPAGAAVVPKGCCGAANVICDWIFRGAGDKDNKQLCDALEGLGLHRSSSVSSSHLSIGAALEAENLVGALKLFSDIILNHHLPEEQFEFARQLAIDSVQGLDDDPRQKVMLKLKEHFYPSPLGRSIVGDIEELNSLSPDRIRQITKECFYLSETIFAVAGKYDFDTVVKQMENLFDIPAKETAKAVEAGHEKDKYTHIQNQSAQVHIGLMTETVRPCDEDYYNARVAVSVLSGGMSARLFTEVREKRGLCYAVGAKYHSLKQAAGISCYAGTTPDKAQETLDVIIAEFNRLREGISKEEIKRAKVGLKSSLILQSESSSSRASGIAADYYMLERVRSLDEIKEKIEQTSVDSVLNFLNENSFKEFTVVTIGPAQVKVK
ncbi:MAG: M16 family metallopeptidase [Planctomycetota bacterium]|jgi:predicted Zn-dependent peptidase